MLLIHTRAFIKSWTGNELTFVKPLFGRQLVDNGQLVRTAGAGAKRRYCKIIAIARREVFEMCAQIEDERILVDGVRDIFCKRLSAIPNPQ